MMPRHSIFLLIVACFTAGATLSAQSKLDRNSAPAKGTGKQFSFPTVVEKKLDNGLLVKIVHRPAVPIVEFQLLIHGGTMQEEVSNAGVAGLVSQMLFLGTQTRTAQQIAGELGKNGITMYASTNYAVNVVAGRCTPQKLRAAFDLLSDVIRTPLFPEEYLPRFKQQQVSALERQLRDPVQTASLLFATQLYGQTHPLARSLSGLFPALDSMTIDAVRRYHTTYYRPNNAVLVVSGDVTPASFLKTIEDVMSLWQPATIPSIALPEAQVPDSLRIFVVNDSSSSRAEIRIGHVGIGRASLLFHPAIVMNQIFAGGPISRLNKEMWAEKKISSSFRSMLGFQREAGFFVVSGNCKNKDAADAVDVVLAGMRDVMTRKPAEGELRYAKSALTKAYALEFQNNQQVLAKLQEHVLFNIPVSSFTQMVPSVQSLQPDDILSAAQSLLDPIKACVVIVGDAREFYPALAKQHGTAVRVLDITPPETDGSSGE